MAYILYAAAFNVPVLRIYVHSLCEHRPLDSGIVSVWTAKIHVCGLITAEDRHTVPLLPLTVT